MVLCASIATMESMTALAISVGTAVFAAIKFFRYDQRISKQEILLNEIQLAEAREKADNKRKADVQLSFITSYKAPGKLNVYNKGLASARDIKISFTGDMSFFHELKSGLTIEKLDSLKNKDYSVTMIDGHPSEIRAQISWSDDFSSNNTKEVIVFIPNRP